MTESANKAAAPPIAPRSRALVRERSAAALSAVARPLRILLGNHTLSVPGGAETWTDTLARELQRRGALVECFSPILGAVSDALAGRGIACGDRFGLLWRLFSRLVGRRGFDVIIANHNDIVLRLRREFSRTPIISTIHGVIHRVSDDAGLESVAPEHPALDAGVSRFVSVSEEVRDVLVRDFRLPSVIVRNFIDLGRFSASRPAAWPPRRILFNSNYSRAEDEEVQIIQRVAERYSADFLTVGVHHTRVMDVAEVIESADVVVGLGRSVLEGVAMGRLGLVHGRWGTGGVVGRDTVAELRRCNFSGRNAGGRLMDPEAIIRRIDSSFSPQTLRWGMEYVQRDHNVVAAAAQYLDFSRQLLEQRCAVVPEP